LQNWELAGGWLGQVRLAINALLVKVRGNMPLRVRKAVSLG